MPASIRRASHGAIGADVELLAGREDRVPQLVAAAEVEQVDLEPGDRGPAGPADHDRDALDLVRAAPVVLEVEDLVAHELLERLDGLRSLDLHGVHVGQRHLRVQAGVREDAQRVEPGVGVGELHPPPVLLDVQEDRVVHDAAVGRGDQHVLALTDRTLRQIAAGDHVDQAVGVGAAHLDRPLDAHVPERHVVVERVVLHLGVVVVAREVHVVVDVVGGAAGPAGRLEHRRLAVPGAEVQRGALLEHLLALVRHLEVSPSLVGRARTPWRRLNDGSNEASVASRAARVVPIERPGHGRGAPKGASSQRTVERLRYASGICFCGSTNGISTTTALRSPHSLETPSDVPWLAYCVGTHAYPMFFFRRGE